MKTTKRIAALLMAVVMVFAMSAVAFADTYSGSSTDENDQFTFTKSIYVRNHLEGTYYSPNVTFTYTIAPATEDYDAHAESVQVYPGKTGGLVGVATGNETIENDGATVKVAFSSQSVSEVNPEGKAVTETVTLKVVKTAFAGETKPGVYRYKITDSTSADTLTAAGLVRPSDYETERFIDVYMKMGTSDSLEPVIVVVAKEEKVPTTNDDGDIVATDGTTFDPDKVYVDENGNIYEVNTDPAPVNDPPVYPTDYHDSEKDTTMVKALVKDGDVFNDKPVPNFTDENNDGKPDDTNGDGIIDDDDGATPATDDEGNPIGEDGKPVPGGTIDPTDGTIIDAGNNDTDKKQLAYGNFTYTGDTYTTYNVMVKKVVTGTMGQKDHQFPFTAAVDNKGYAFVTSKAGADTEQTAGTTSVSFTLADSETFYIRGLSPLATVNYTETNDSKLVYMTKATDTADATEVAEKALNKNDTYTAFNANKAVTNYSSSATEGELTTVSTITFINNQTDFSPTGVVLRFAPYILMLGAAMFFVVLARKQREQENA
jgi:hypothetical protein